MLTTAPTRTTQPHWPCSKHLQSDCCQRRTTEYLRCGLQCRRLCARRHRLHIDGNFPGISGVHTYVKTDDGVAGFGGGDVDNRTYKNNTTSLVLLKGTYDVKVVKGAQANIYESVNCTGITCTIDNIVATFTLNFPGKTGVHTYVKTDDGMANSATGGDVDNRTYQNNSTTLVLLKNYYDVVVKIGTETYILDEVDCTGDICTYSLTVVKLLDSNGNGLADGVAQYYKSGWKTIGTTPSNGTLSFAIPGAPATYSFRMSYAGFTQQQSNINIATTNPIIFQTLPAVVHFQDSISTPLADGGVQYYASGWKTFGSGLTDASGDASMELLPGSYSFRMHWKGYTQQQSNVNIATTNPVIFQTYPMVVHFRDSQNVALAGGGVDYYASGWKTFGGGLTDVSGDATMELLPGSYSFRMHWKGYTQQQSNINIMTENPLDFQTLSVYAQLQQKTYAERWNRRRRCTILRIRLERPGHHRCNRGYTSRGITTRHLLLPHDLCRCYRAAIQRRYLHHQPG